MSAASPQVQASRQRSVLNSSVLPDRETGSRRVAAEDICLFARGQIGQQSLCGTEAICIAKLCDPHSMRGARMTRGRGFTFIEALEHSAIRSNF